jgi:hypothetical protein
LKKPTRKKRELDVKYGLKLRLKGRRTRSTDVTPPAKSNWREVKRWIDEKSNQGLNFSTQKNNRLILYLPEIMNFSDHYEESMMYIIAIRKLVNRKFLPNKAYKLMSVNFDSLRNISTSTALVLTAELSRWDDAIRQNLTPKVEGWSPDIVQQLKSLGFFDLFKRSPGVCEESLNNTNLQLVKYIKGQCKDKSKTRVLKDSIQEIVGDKISKWTFLHSGLTEAITNVSHHAYPDTIEMNGNDKNWYLTGSYNKTTSELKIAFYDQGIGIPRSLPASEVWEKVLKYMSKLSRDERKLHTTLLKAAVQLDRTSTLENDRGKGLPDLLEFIKQRADGYLSIISLKGLYKYTISNGKEYVKTEPFNHELPGTLIIWSVRLGA